MKSRILYILTASLAIICGTADAGACTSAIISAKASASGRPMLWKHRDTSTTDNKVEYVPSEDGRYAFVALFNANDSKLREAWTGMNEVGFAVMNTASYNIKDDNVPQKEMDKEGIVMKMALQSCRTVDDFEELLTTLPRPMGVEANFGVIDATGAGAFFETNNHSFVKYDLADAPGGVLIRTNYSHSGRKNEGFGYIRESNAEHLLQPYIDRGNISAELLTEDISRNFYHDLYKENALNCGRQWLVDQDFIPRYKSTATIVIEGVVPEEGKDMTPAEIVNQYVMWTGLGYPPVAEIVPVWCDASGVDPGLRGITGRGTSAIGDRAKARRDEVFSLGRDNKDKYINSEVLCNNAGTGYMQTIVPRNLAVYRLISDKRDKRQIDFSKSRKSKK